MAMHVTDYFNSCGVKHFPVHIARCLYSHHPCCDRKFREVADRQREDGFAPKARADGAAGAEGGTLPEGFRVPERAQVAVP